MNLKLFVSAGSQKLHYIKWGSGSRLLLAFHGYGNDASIFRLFEPYLSTQYTILSFDLPHHGESKWTADSPLSKKDLAAMAKGLMAEYKVDKISLLGYSMGGRVCLTLMEQMPESIARAVLIATDGLATDYIYSFFTRTFIGRKIFRNLLDKPGRYLRFIDWLKQKKLLDETRHKFVMKYIKTGQNRAFLGQVWPGMSQLRPLYAKLKAGIKKYHIPVSLVMGAHDRIMPPSRAQRFKKGLDTVQVYVLDKGHRVFDEGNAGDIAKWLL